MILQSHFIRKIFNLYSNIYGNLTYILHRYLPIPPSKITFKITNICNVDCHFCYNAELNTQSERKKEISLDKWKKLVDSIPFFTAISFTGGEAFLYPHIFELLNYIAKKKRKVSIVSNGTTLNYKQIRDLVEYQVYYLMFSIHGNEKTHNEILKGNQNHYQKMIENIKLLAQIKREKKSKFPIIGIKVTVTNENVDQLQEIVDLAKNELGASTVYFNFITNESYKLHDNLEDVFKRVNSIFEYDDNVKNKIIQFSRITKTNNDIDVGFSLKFKDEKELERYIEKPNNFQNAKCNIPWHEIYVLPDGSLTTCLKYKIGNIEDIDYDVRKISKLDKYCKLLDAFKLRNRRSEFCRACEMAPMESLTKGDQHA